VVGALTVAAAVTLVVLGLTRGWQAPVSRAARSAVLLLGAGCALVGMAVAFG